MYTFIARLNAPITLALALIAGLALFSTTYADDSTVSSGQFTGINDHTVSGKVSIVKTDAGYEIVMADDFMFDGAPDPKVALGNDGEYDPATQIEPLKSDSGAQTYIVPASVDISQFNEVHIWCEKFSVGLAIAPLQ